ncbi:MAG TPA: S9 family peptidase [Flavipsychrobacter sp.]|nr:S9 family peptidase [Flavipsychrobacter sp.]
MKKTFLALLLLAATGLPALAQKQTPLIDREKFFGDPEVRGAQLSPDGKWMSYIKNYNDIPNIWVKKTEEAFDKGKPLTNDKRPISGYFWSKDGKYILYMQDKGGNENYNIYAVNPQDAKDAKTGVPKERNLTPKENVVAYIMAVSEKDPDMLFVGMNDRDASWHDLYSVKISTGELKLISENKDRISGYVFDWNDKLRMATRSNADGSSDILTYQPDGSYKKIYSAALFESANPYYFTPDNSKVYLVTNTGANRDLTELQLMDPATGAATFVEKDPENKVDFGGLNISDKTHEPIFSIYQENKPRIYWKDKNFESHYNSLKQQFAGKEISFNGSNKNEDLWLISVYSDTDPGAVYLYDMKTKKTTFQYRPRKELNPDDLAPMQILSYPSSDGLMIPAYLTIPKGSDGKNLPLIVNPHGGPWSRDGWGYNSFAQFLANRGYAVLQMNFRGSTGYGKKFIDAGNLEWGKLMQDDITWGVKYLVDKGIVDKKRVGIMGGSYGGYATLAGLTFTPDVYAAGVDIVGPSNLITLLKSIPAYWESGRKEFTERMGNYETPEGEKFLKEISPLFHVDKIRAPLMVVQGANDPRVKKAESDQIVIAMRDKKLPVEYLLAMDEGHGFHDTKNNMAFLAAAEKFLAKHLGGRYQESMKPEIAERQKKITVDINTVKMDVAVDAGSLAPISTTGSLTERNLVYDMTIEAQGQKMNFDYNVATKKDGVNWKFIESAKTPFGDMKQEALVSGKDYALINKTIEQGPAKINYAVNGESITGSMEAMGNKQPINADVKGKVLFAGDEGVGQCIALLPLKKGYTTSYTSIDQQSMEAKDYIISVLDDEKVTVPKGTATCKKIELYEKNEPSKKSYAWIDMASKTVYKMEVDGGQMKYSFQLK